jgi:hypothetical protein
MHNVFLALFFMSAALYAQQDDLSKRIHMVDTAIDYATIQRYDYAKKTLEQLRSMNIPDEEQAIAVYDLATISLQEGRFRQAEKLFIELQTNYTIPPSIAKDAAINYAFASLLNIKNVLDTSIQQVALHEDLVLFQNRASQIESQIKQYPKSMATLLVEVPQKMVLGELIQKIQDETKDQLLVRAMRDLLKQKQTVLSYRIYTKDLSLVVEAVGIPLLERLQLVYKKLTLLEEKAYMTALLQRELMQLQMGVRQKDATLFLDTIDLVSVIMESMRADDPILFLLQRRAKEHTASLTDSIVFALDERIRHMGQSDHAKLLKQFTDELAYSNDAERDLFSFMRVTYNIEKNGWDLQKRASFAAQFEDLVVQYEEKTKSDMKDFSFIDQSIQFLLGCKERIDPKSPTQQQIEALLQHTQEIKQGDGSIDTRIQLHKDLRAFFMQIKGELQQKQKQQEQKEVQARAKLTLQNAVQTLLDVEQDDQALVPKVQPSIQESARPW